MLVAVEVLHGLHHGLRASNISHQGHQAWQGQNNSRGGSGTRNDAVGGKAVHQRPVGAKLPMLTNIAVLQSLREHAGVDG